MSDAAENQPDVIDVTEANFEYAVMAASRHRPVLVDFWAEWCQPCKVLGPILEKLAAEYKGAFLLAKINVEQAPYLAEQFQAQSIPMVLLVKEEQVAGHFLGALTEDQVREFLQQHIPTEADRGSEDAVEIERSGDLSAAEAAYRRALEADPKQPAASLGLARVLLARCQIDEAAAQLTQVDEASPAATHATRHKDALDFWHEAVGCGDEAECRSNVENSPHDNDKQLKYAACLATNGKIPEALETLLGILGRDKSYRDGLARKAMLSLFDFFAETSEIPREYQSRMATLLY